MITRPASERLAETHCVACALYQRPQDAPWSQHAIGCPLRDRGIAQTSQ
jgi:hypothetical protein